MESPLKPEDQTPFAPLRLPMVPSSEDGCESVDMGPEFEADSQRPMPQQQQQRQQQQRQQQQRQQQQRQQQQRHSKYLLETLLNGMKEVVDNADSPTSQPPTRPVTPASLPQGWSPALSSPPLSSSSSTSSLLSPSLSSSCSPSASSSPSASVTPRLPPPAFLASLQWNGDTISSLPSLRNVVVQSSSSGATTSLGRTQYPTECQGFEGTLPTLAALASETVRLQCDAPARQGPSPVHEGPSQRKTDRRKKTGNLPRVVTEDLKKWIIEHKSHPFPSEVEKEHFAKKHHLSLNQVNNWFINARRRVLTKRITNSGEYYVVTDKYAKREARKHWMRSQEDKFDSPSSSEEEGAEATKMAGLTLSALGSPRPDLQRTAPPTTALAPFPHTAGHYFLQAPPTSSPPHCSVQLGGENLFFMFQNGLREARDRGENNPVEFLGRFFLNESERTKQG